MVADPIPAPVTCGCVTGVVAPAAIKTLEVTVTLVVSLLTRFTVTPPPPAGAASDRLTPKVAVCPRPMGTFAGTMIEPPDTFTVAVALKMPLALAVIVAEPPVTPVTVTTALVAPAAKLTLDGTVATPVLLELRLTVKPLAGACPPVKFKVRFPVLPAVIPRVVGVKLMVGGVTVTVPVPDV
jgi:hypothetical protein